MKNGNDSTRLIEQAVRRLLPDVFFHPVWTHFGATGTLLSLERIQRLLAVVDEMLSAGYLGDACQILFICVFLQICAGNYTAASSSIHRIVIFAKQYELPQVAWWAAWAAAAICVQRGLYRQAAEHLEHLHFMLDQQPEWILSDIIDVLRQDLLGQAEVTPANRPLSSDAALSYAFEQLLHWGTPCAAIASNANGSTGGNGHIGHSAPLPSGTIDSTLRSFWQRIKRIANGELQLKWVETNGFAPLPHPEKRNPLMPASPIVMAPASALMPSSLDQSLTLNRQSEFDQLSTAAEDGVPVAIRPVVPHPPEPVSESPAPPSITAHLLGTFSFSVDDATVQSWPTGKCRTVFKYLLAHHHQPIPRDVLMDVFWPQACPEAARNSLNGVLHGLRQALKSVTDKSVILFEEGAYGINPEFHIWTDVDEFDRHVQAGRRLEAKEQLVRAVPEYEAAMELYQGDFLSGDLYEEWPVLTRERLRAAYQDTLDRLSRIFFTRQQYTACEAICQQILSHDNCREDAHCLLMRCYSRQEQHHLALRQYQACVDALRSELDVAPAPATEQLFERIRRREPV